MFMMKSKKGFVPMIIGALLTAPWVLLGLGIFVVLLLLGIYFALGKLIGAGLIVFGGFLISRFDWRIGAVIMGVGLLFFYNPFDWDTLSAVPLSAYTGWFS